MSSSLRAVPSTRGSPRSGPVRSAPRILRACVVQGGKVLEEQRLPRHHALTIGTSAKNTFIIPASALPKSHELFVHRGGQYELVFTDAMRGKISPGGQQPPVDLASLKAQGLVHKKGGAYHLPLSDAHRGKVMIGDVTIIFQFVVPPPVQARPKLPAAARASLIDRIDWPFFSAILFMTVLELPAIIAFQYMDPPDDLTIDTMDSRWANLIVPDYEPEKKEDQPELDKKAEGQGPTIKKALPTVSDDDPDVSQKRAQRKAAIREGIQGKGMLQLLGTVGESGIGGAIADVFAEGGGVNTDLDSAFEGISGVGVAQAGGPRSTRGGGGSGEAAGIGDLATSGGGNVGSAAKKVERRVKAVATAATPEVDGALDGAAIARVVRTRMRSIQDCYERELKRDPSLAGKIEVEFTIGESGRVEEALVVSNSMGSDGVGNCIVGRVRRWRFPAPDGGSVTVTFPFIFTASG